MNKKVKFAVVGCGHIGKRHAKMIQENKSAELVALVDIQDKNNLSIQEFNVPFFKSIKELIESELEIDVVNIATPNGLHAEQALITLDYNKHVVIEKPIALSKLDAEKIISKSLLVNKHVFAVMQNRYSPPSAWLKEIVDSGILGNIYIVQLNCYWNRDARYYKKESWHGKLKEDGGTLFTQFSHFIDILYWLFGDIKNIKSKLFDFNHKNLTEFEDTGIVTFDFVNEGSGVINFSTSVWDKNLESSMLIIAENGSIKIGGQYMDEVTYCHIKNYEMPILKPTNPGNDYGLYKGSAQNHDFVIQNVIEVLNNKANITTNALEGLKVVDIIERIYESKIQK
jgi:UDP-N-acetyl-2-amino-2-deoxyglucuronate dehydrogenase